MAADGTTFPPFQTIPDLIPVASLKFTAQVWISQDGKDWRANIGDIAAVMPPHVTSFNGRTGDVGLSINDITQAGGAPNTSPFLGGVPQAPTPPRGADDTRIATTEFVQDAIIGQVAGVSSFNGRQGDVVLTTADVTGVGGALASQLANYLPLAGGNVTGPVNFASSIGVASTATVGDLTITASKPISTVLAAPALGGAPSFRRLSAADITGLTGGTVTSVGVTVPGDMTVSGSPITTAGTINITRNSQPASFALISPVVTGGIPAYRALTQADISNGVGVTSVALNMPTMFNVSGGPITTAGAFNVTLAPVGNNLVFAGPTAGGPLTPTFRQLTAADITGLPTGSVTSVGLSMPSDFTVTNSPVTGAGTLTVTRNSEAANLVLASPNGAAGVPTYRALQQADITGGVGVTSVGLNMPTGFVVVGSPVTGSGNITVALTGQPASSVLAAPAGGGIPSFRPLTQADITGGVGVTSVGLTMPADFSVANSPVTGSGNLIVSRNTQAGGLFLASPAGAAGTPSYRALAASDLPAGTGTVTSVGLGMPSPFIVTGTNPITTNGIFAVGVQSQNANTVWAGPVSGGAAAPGFRGLVAADIPSLSGLYLPLAGGNLTGPLTGTTLALGGALGAGDLLSVYSSTASPQIEAIGDGQIPIIYSTGYFNSNSAPSFLGRHARGTLAAPLPVAAGDAAATFTGQAWDGASWLGLGYVRTLVDTINGPGDISGDLSFATRPNGVGATLIERLRIDRNGAATFSGTVTNAGETVNGPATFTGPSTFSGGLTASGGGPANALAVDGPVATVRQFNFTSAGSLRWRIGVNSTPEGGSNAGSDFFINNFTDAGTLLGTALTITRATMAATFGGPVTAPNYTATGSALPTNGMYLPAANVLGFAQNSVGRWFISSTNGLLHNSTGGQVSPLSMNKGIFVGGAVGLTQCLQAGYSADATTGNGIAIYGNATNGGVSQISTNYATTDGPLNIGTFTRQNALQIAVDGGLLASAVVPGGSKGPGTLNLAGPIYIGGNQLGVANMGDFTARTAWTPTWTFGTPGDLTVAYTTQSGWYLKIGPMVFWWVSLVCTPTYTSASGAGFIAGFPLSPTSIATGWITQFALGAATWQAGSTQVVPLWSAGQLEFGGLKPQSNTNVFQAASFPSGSGIIIAAAGWYMI